MRGLRWVLSVGCSAAVVLALAGCEPAPTVEELSGPTMGSTYSVKYVRSEGVAPREVLQETTDAFLGELDRHLSTYRSDSDISRFNAMPAGACMAMPTMALQLVQAGEQLSSESGGALDLTVGPLLDLWGFGPQSRGERIPGPDEIARVRARVGHQHLRIDGDQLCKTGAVQLDFNSIAAGYAVDAVGERLRALGVTSYLVEITGELKAEGRKPDGSNWRVAIEAPRDNARVAQQIIALDGLATSTSGDYRNYFERDGKRYSHTLDPQTGAPITHALAAVTVVDASALRADGLSTVLMVLGPERGLAYAERHRLAALFVTRAGEGFQSTATERFAALFGEGETQ